MIYTPFFLAITGGIACGKTLVYNCFRELGVQGISADEICRELTMPGQAALREIEEVFGKEALEISGKMNREYVGNIIFSNPEKRKLLNNILHPKVEKKILYWKDKIKSLLPSEKIAVLEIPLFFETGSYFWVDGILTVCADEKTCVERMSERDGLLFDECRRRYNAQIAIEDKKKRSQWVLHNNGTKEKVCDQTQNIYIDIIRKEKEKIWKS